MVAKYFRRIRTLFRVALVALLASATVTSAAVISTCTKPGMVAFTFDDGPSLENGYKLLDYLEALNVKVTFHWVTEFLGEFALQQLVERASISGHLIGLRAEVTWDLHGLSASELSSRLQNTRSILAKYSGYQPTFLRLPYGNYTEEQVAAAESLGFIVTSHSVDGYSYLTNNSGTVINNVESAFGPLVPGPQPSNIILLQEYNSWAVEAMPELVNFVRNRGYKIVRLDECLGVTVPELPRSTTTTTTLTTTQADATVTSTVTVGVAPTISHSGPPGANAAAVSSQGISIYGVGLTLIVGVLFLLFF